MVLVTKQPWQLLQKPPVLSQAIVMDWSQRLPLQIACCFLLGRGHQGTRGIRVTLLLQSQNAFATVAVTIVS